MTHYSERKRQIYCIIHYARSRIGESNSFPENYTI